jgi:hypothetical protein
MSEEVGIDSDRGSDRWMLSSRLVLTGKLIQRGDRLVVQTEM